MRLSKSDFKTARDCPAKLYYKKLRYPSSLDEDPYLAFLADGGYMVEAMAKLLFPGGVEVGNWSDPEEAFAETTDLLSAGDTVLFEPTVIHGDYLARIDILIREGNTLKLIEVKSTSVDTSDPDQPNPFRGKRGGIPSGWRSYLEDVTFQVHVLSLAFPGYTVRPYLCVVDKACRASSNSTFDRFTLTRDPGGHSWAPEVFYTGDVASLGDDHLLAILDVNTEVEELLPEVVSEAGRFARSLTGERVERLAGGLSASCKGCEYRVDNTAGEKNGFRECWGRFAETSPHILDLYRIDLVGGKNHNFVEEMIDRGSVSLLDIPAERLSGAVAARQLQQIDCQASGSEWIAPVLPPQLRDLPKPFHFIDFEASRLAIPYHEGMRPYELAAFQWSCHTLEDFNAPIRHEEWLNSEEAFPNFAFARSLRECIGDEGTIFIYSHYEITTLREVRRQMDDYDEADESLAEWLDWMIDPGNSRVVDLLPLAKEHYVHPEMKGSLSIKYLLPAVWLHNTSLREMEVFSEYVGYDESGNLLNPYDVLPALPIGDAEEAVREGTGAMRAYQEMMFGLSSQAPEKKEALRKLLLQYCKLDTAAMVMIWRHWISA